VRCVVGLVFQVYTILTTVSSTMNIFTADVDGDAKLDVITADQSKLIWNRNAGGSPPGWTPYEIASSTNGFRSVGVEDVDVHTCVYFGVGA
jgi:hypothetical protein